MDNTLNMLSPQFLLSLIVSFVMAVIFIQWQLHEYIENKNAIARLKRFFQRKKTILLVRRMMITSKEITL